jgi:hypothetical protein
LGAQPAAQVTLNRTRCADLTPRVRTDVQGAGLAAQRPNSPFNAWNHSESASRFLNSDQGSALWPSRVDLLHLLEDLRDAYPGAVEETILTEVVANSLDSAATRARSDTASLD